MTDYVSRGELCFVEEKTKELFRNIIGLVFNNSNYNNLYQYFIVCTIVAGQGETTYIL